MARKYKFAFEKLDVWRLSINFTKTIYMVTKDFPSEEKFGIISQLRRASSSISANIAEGSTRKSNKEKARFYEIAYGSTIEVLNFLILSFELGFVNEQTLEDLDLKIGELSNKINALHKSQLNR